MSEVIYILIGAIGVATTIYGSWQLNKFRLEKKWFGERPPNIVYKTSEPITLSMSFKVRDMDGTKMFGMLGGEKTHTLTDDHHLEWLIKNYTQKLAQKLIDDNLVEVVKDQVTSHDTRIILTIKLCK